MIEHIRKILIIALLTCFPVFVIAGEPAVTSVTMVPANPTYGQVVTITVGFCGQMYNGQTIAIAVSTNSTFADARISGIGQVFVVSDEGIDVHMPRPGTSSDPAIGYQATANPNGGTANCRTCGSGSNDGISYTRQYVVHIPSADSFPGCSNTNLYLHVGMKDGITATNGGLHDGDWQGLPTCQTNKLTNTISWTLPLLPAAYTALKRVEGVIQDPGDLVLFSIDYEYANGPLMITDTIPGGGDFELVSYGPTVMSGPPAGSVTGPAIGSPTGTFIWNLPDRTGQRGSATGTVWMLYRVRTGVNPVGKSYTNTANITMNGLTTPSNTVNIVGGRATITLAKSQSDIAVNQGDNITYYLEYEVNGSRLVVYQPFDDLSGTYTGGAAPTGWRNLTEGGAAGSWTISEYCGTGDRVLTGAGALQEYPAMVYDQYEFCEGTIMADVFINPAGSVGGTGYDGADSLVIIRSNGLDDAPGQAYGLVLSIDDFIGTTQGGYVGFQKCGPTVPGNCQWPLGSNAVGISGNKWYRVKIETITPFSWRAKVWIKGDPEPSGWLVSWADNNAAIYGPQFDCLSTPYVGFGQQSGESGTPAQDSYNNLVVYENRAFSNAHVYDTVPVGLSYASANGLPGPAGFTGPSKSAGMIAWTIPSLQNTAGTLTWWAEVTGCDPVTNISAIDADDPVVPILSNPTVFTSICPDPVVSVTKTAQPTTARVGDTITYTIAYSNVGTRDIPSFYLWDTIPTTVAHITAVTINDGGTQFGNLITWGPRVLNVGQSGTYSWIGVITSIPYLPMFDKEYLGYLIDRYTFGTERKGS